MRDVLFASLALLTHTSSVMFLSLRVLVSDKIYKFIKPFRYVVVFWTLGSEIMARQLEQFGISFTRSAAQMLMFYINEERTISYRLTAARMVMIILVFCMYYSIKRNDKAVYIKDSKYFAYVELCLLFTLGSIFDAVFFQRNSFFVGLICMPLFLKFLQSTYVPKRTKQVCIFIAILLSLGMFANQIYGLALGYF